MTIKKLRVQLASLLVCLSAAAHAQECSSLVEETAPASDFVLSGGLATHRLTGLTWQRCMLGMEWDAETGTCTGEDKWVTWDVALSTATDFTSGGYSDWRLPNKNELASIVERACSGPAIDLTVFPLEDGEPYWTSTPKKGLDAMSWFVNFLYGQVSYALRTETVKVRLVRGG